MKLTIRQSRNAVFAGVSLIALTFSMDAFAAKPVPYAAPRTALLRQAAGSDEAMLRQGRAIVALMAKKDVAGIFARFDSRMAAALPRTQLESILSEVVTPESPLGARFSDEITDLHGVPAYVAQHHAGPGKLLQITLVLTGPGSSKISGMFFKPLEAPPAAPLSATAKAGVLAAGRSVAALIAKKDASELFARFTPEMAADVPRAAVVALLNSLITTDTPLGGALSEAAESGVEGGTAAFSAKYRWKKEQPLSLKVIFVTGSGGKIAGMILQQEAPKTIPPDPHTGYRLKAPLSLPFTTGEKWTVVWGGDTVEQNYHVAYPDQRHAFDIVIMRDSRTHDGDGKSLNQYYCFGKPILAPANGKVVEAVNSLPDNAPGQMDAKNPAGNHILLSTGNSEYVLLAHMQRGSIAVKAGDSVQRGSLVGKCGNSGNTSEPHLHIHVQDKPYLFRDALGLPATFTGYISDGKPVDSGSPAQGEVVAATPSQQLFIQKASK